MLQQIQTDLCYFEHKYGELPSEIIISHKLRMLFEAIHSMAFVMYPNKVRTLFGIPVTVKRRGMEGPDVISYQFALPEITLIPEYE